ncbi:hypothetical protein [Ruminococcus sp.]|uniref:hypothetical protein n=1 Tax=Ruminococcus sp. TaxID=41978 RepID=UPI0025F6A887|nr:hypothetical protein [Ruminococcus sp.]MBQ8967126.1 hypothetical protein [Ruminococcus sp.]
MKEITTKFVTVYSKLFDYYEAIMVMLIMLAAAAAIYTGCRNNGLLIPVMRAIQYRRC